MTTLDHVYFTGRIPIHGRLVLEIVRHRPVPSGDGTLGPGWDLHLHAEWGCVVVEPAPGEGEPALVPLHAVRSMTLAPPVGQEASGPVAGAGALVADPSTEAGSGPAQGRRGGRGRTKRLDLVRE